MSVAQTKKVSDEYLRSLPIIGKQPATEKEEKHLREICEYEFYNLEEPGIAHTFSYGGMGTDEKVKNHTFNFFHGGKYRVPRFIARHLESSVTPIWEWRPNGMGKMDKKLVGNKPRFRMSQVF